MAKIYVLGGGISDERDVSLRSSAEVLRAAEALGYNVEFIDPKISKDYLLATNSDIVLPILHGKFGEDGVLQAELEERNIPFLGAGSESSKNSFDKWLTRQILEQNDIKMPKAALVTYSDYFGHDISKMPHVLKIVDGGSSIGTYIIRDPSDGSEAELKDIFQDQKLVLEQLIIGTEITVPILGENALPVIEIIPPPDGEFDYENKYNGRTRELCPPENVSDAAQKQVRQIAEQVHNVMACRHFSRVDIMIDENDQQYVLEINTIPGLTAQSLFPQAARVAGMTMEQLVKQFVELVAADYGLNPNSFYKV